MSAPATHRGSARGALRTEPRDTLNGSWRIADPADPAVAVLLEDLVREYTLRYGDSFDGQPHSARNEINRYPRERFVAPDGAFLLYEEGGEVISGGAIMRLDASTAEVKRVWTHPEHRGRGLAAATMAGLEATAAQLGYTRIYLTTGPAQPEAVALYLATGYTPGFDPAGYPATAGPHPFTKDLAPTGAGDAAKRSNSTSTITSQEDPA